MPLPWILASLLLAAPPPPVESRAPTLSLAQVVERAQASSPSALSARHRLRSSYWQYVTSRADRRPALRLLATLPSFSRGTSRYSLADGTDAFIHRSVANSTAGLSLSMDLPPTGGQLVVSTGLQRIDVLDPEYDRSYLATPVTFGLRQPLFAYNDARWQARIDPIRFDEAQRQYLADMEDIAITAIGAFYDLLSAQTTLADALANQASSDTLLAIARRRPGHTAENELLQLELASLNAGTQAARARIDLRSRRNQLNTYLGLEEGREVHLAESGETPALLINEDEAIAQASRASVRSISYDHQLVDADRDVAQASAPRTSMMLYASYGLSRSTTQIQQVLTKPERQEEASLVIEIPVFDWGRSKGRRLVAESNREVVRTNVDQGRRELARDVRLQVAEMDLQVDQLSMAFRADDLAQRRYGVARTEYLGGRESMDALNIAQSEKDQARRNYYDALRGFWTKYYELRRSTLFDFALHVPLEVDPRTWD